MLSSHFVLGRRFKSASEARSSMLWRSGEAHRQPAASVFAKLLSDVWPSAILATFFWYGAIRLGGVNVFNGFCWTAPWLSCCGGALGINCTIAFWNLWTPLLQPEAASASFANGLADARPATLHAINLRNLTIVTGRDNVCKWVCRAHVGRGWIDPS
eukprot:2858599-Amphidinium_carterae.1